MPSRIFLRDLPSISSIGIVLREISFRVPTVFSLRSFHGIFSRVYPGMFTGASPRIFFRCYRGISSGIPLEQFFVIPSGGCPEIFPGILPRISLRDFRTFSPNISTEVELISSSNYHQLSFKVPCEICLNGSRRIYLEVPLEVSFAVLHNSYPRILPVMLPGDPYCWAFSHDLFQGFIQSSFCNFYSSYCEYYLCRSCRDFFQRFLQDLSSQLFSRFRAVILQRFLFSNFPRILSRIPSTNCPGIPLKVPFGVSLIDTPKVLVRFFSRVFRGIPSGTTYKIPSKKFRKK